MSMLAVRAQASEKCYSLKKTHLVFIQSFRVLPWQPGITIHVVLQRKKRLESRINRVVAAGRRTGFPTRELFDTPAVSEKENLPEERPPLERRLSSPQASPC